MKFTCSESEQWLLLRVCRYNNNKGYCYALVFNRDCVTISGGKGGLRGGGAHHRTMHIDIIDRGCHLLQSALDYYTLAF